MIFAGQGGDQKRVQETNTRPATRYNANPATAARDSLGHASKGAGLAIVDRNRMVEELADGMLAQDSDIEVTEPYGYWLDVAPRHAALEHVQAFGGWRRLKVSKTG